MKKIDYLKLVIQQKIVNNRSWIITAFSITKGSNDTHNKDIYYLKLIPETWGYSFINEKAESIKIDDGKPNQPLFKFNEIITLSVYINLSVVK
jgi:hypothetical protein